MERKMIEKGQIVVDREDPEDKLLVSALTGEESREWFISEIGKTVAEVNPAYSDTSEVVLAKYVKDIQSYDEKLRLEKRIIIENHKKYSFPSDRLKPYQE